MYQLARGRPVSELECDPRARWNSLRNRILLVELAFAAGRDHMVRVARWGLSFNTDAAQQAKGRGSQVTHERGLLLVPVVDRAGARTTRGRARQVTEAARLVHELPREDVRRALVPVYERSDVFLWRPVSVFARKEGTRSD